MHRTRPAWLNGPACAQGEGAQKADEVKAAADTGEARSSSISASEPCEDSNGKQKRLSNPSSSSLANKIAAFASGVAPVKKGIKNASEDGITVEEVLHKLESAARVSQVLPVAHRVVDGSSTSAVTHAGNCHQLLTSSTQASALPKTLSWVWCSHFGA
jgi:hypothetical protein